MLVVGSRLRSNETLKYRLKLPQPLYRIDADALAENRCYASELFVHGDAELALNGLADRLAGRIEVDPAFAADLAAARAGAEALIVRGLGPYQRLVEALQQALGRDFVWVRDVTVSNSTWGNRSLRIAGPRDGVHALGGGIGQGLQMGIGAAIAEREAGAGRKAVALVGDGGLMLNVGELATAAQEQADLLLLIMNNGGYGVIRNIQDAQYGEHHYYVDLHTPDFGALCASLGVAHRRLGNLAEAEAVLR